MDKTQLQQYLDDALRAYHLVATGQHVELVQEDGTRVQYSQANIQVLDNYIQRLRGQLGIRSTRRSGSRRMIF